MEDFYFAYIVHLEKTQRGRHTQVERGTILLCLGEQNGHPNLCFLLSVKSQGWGKLVGY